MFLKIIALNFTFWFFPTVIGFVFVSAALRFAAKRRLTSKRAGIYFLGAWAIVSAISSVATVNGLSDSFAGWGIFAFPILASTIMITFEFKLKQLPND